MLELVVVVELEEIVQQLFLEVQLKSWWISKVSGGWRQ
jgi:hypothetical protein